MPTEMIVTLITPQSDISSFGVRLLSAYLKQYGVSTRLIFLPDPAFDREATAERVYAYSDEVLSQIREICHGSTLVGISLFSCHVDRAIQITDYLRKCSVGPIVWGGVHPTAAPEHSLKHNDIICLGEGEESLLELVRCIAASRDYSRTAGLWVKKDGEIIRNPMMPLQRDLDRLPFQDYSLDNHYLLQKENHEIVKMTDELLMKTVFREPRGGKPVYQTMVSRGCPHNCTYCFTFKTFYEGQKYVRHRSAQNVISEMQQIRDRFKDFGLMVINDDSFFDLPEAEIKSFSELYKEKIPLPFRCLGSPTSITEKKLGYLVDAGLIEIQLGIQTASEETKKTYNRMIANDRIMAVVKTINKFKTHLFPCYDFITDNPYERNEDLLVSLRFIAKLPKPFHIQVFSLIFFPGTRLYFRALKDGIIKEEDLMKVFRKQFQFEQQTYLNFMLHLANASLPRIVYKLLLSDMVVWLLNRKFIGKMCYRLLKAHKRASR